MDQTAGYGVAYRPSCVKYMYACDMTKVHTDAVSIVGVPAAIVQSSPRPTGGNPSEVDEEWLKKNSLSSRRRESARSVKGERMLWETRPTDSCGTVKGAL